MIPLYFFVKKAIDYIYSLVSVSAPLPAIKIDTISEEEKTCVVISTLITSVEDVMSFTEKLRSFQLNNQNPDDALYFGLLCDLKESKKKTLEEDVGIIKALEREIERLNETNPVFFSVIRERVFHESEGAFVGR